MKPNYYAIIPANVRYSEKLTPNAKLLYGEITALCNEKGYCWASNTYFSKLYNVSVRTVQNWIEALRVEGFIDVVVDKEGGNKRFISLMKKSSGAYENNFRGLMKKSSGAYENNFISLNSPNADEHSNREGKKESNNTSNITSNNTSNKRESPSRKEKEDDGLTKQGIEYIKRYWNMVADKTGIPKVLVINKPSSRHTSLNARYKEIGINQIINAIDEIIKSKFLQGNNSKNWTITFDWLINKNNIIKVLEGNYRDKTTKTTIGLVNENYKTATEEEKATDEDGNLISF